MDLRVGQSGNSLLDKSSHLLGPLFFFSNADILLLFTLDFIQKELYTMIAINMLRTTAILQSVFEPKRVLLFATMNHAMKNVAEIHAT